MQKRKRPGWEDRGLLVVGVCAESKSLLERRLLESWVLNADITVLVSMDFGSIFIESQGGDEQKKLMNLNKFQKNK